MKQGKVKTDLCFLAAVLTVDHSVVDLETIEALYENVGTRHCHHSPGGAGRSHSDVVVPVTESAAGRAGEDQEALRDIRGGGGQTAGQT